MIKIYRLLRKFLPSSFHGYLTTLLYDLKIKPSFNRKVKSPFAKGVIVFSADFEMAWAFRYSKTRSQKAEELGLGERCNIPELVALFEKNKIPVTWATVGHLFMDSCEKNFEHFPHPEMPRPTYFENKNWSFQSGDWYQHDPCTNILNSPAWYAPDLIEQIVTSPLNHEIGCHTFSHIDFSYKNCSPELARAEIEKCRELALKKGITLKSMVFPGGTFGNYEILKEQGFTCYRFPMANHIDIPFIDPHGLVAIPSSLGLDRDNYNWSADFHLKIIDSFLKKTIKSKQVCHFWFHPSMDPWYIRYVLPFILEKIEAHVKNGEIEVLTMGALAEKFKTILHD